AALLGEATGAPADEDVVWVALERLEKARLLETEVKPPLGGWRPTRRQVTLGLMLLPAVATILAPTAAQAATCRTITQTCNGATGTQGTCCSGLTCVAGVCV